MAISNESIAKHFLYSVNLAEWLLSCFQQFFLGVVSLQTQQMPIKKNKDNGLDEDRKMLFNRLRDIEKDTHPGDKRIGAVEVILITGLTILKRSLKR